MGRASIDIIVGAQSGRVWHEALVQRLSEIFPSRVTVRAKDEVHDPSSRRLQRLLEFEQRLHGVDAGLIGQCTFADSSVESDIDTDDAPLPSITLDLTSRPEEGAWSVLYDGAPGEAALEAVLRSGRQPLVTVVDGNDIVRAQGRPGTERPGLFTTVMADLGAGVATLVVGALTGSAFASPAEGEEKKGPVRPHLAIAARRLASATIYKLYRFLYRAPHWRVGWRQRISKPDLLEGGTLSATPWHELPDDGFHFYADPFPFEYEGTTYLFVEDFDHRSGKAVISVVELTADGNVKTPKPVLEHDVHLSYPFVIEYDGDIWMIPESSGAKTVELYRATKFPWKWERHSTLIEGLEASDATIFQVDGRWWMTATVGFGGSLSDSLCLWSAPDLRGPWTEHAHNPVLVDIASARPAGRVELIDGRLLRPVQDCRTGYGAALGVAEITRLDDEGYEQRMIDHFSPGEGWGGTRLHTFNRSGAVETIDGSRLVPKFRKRKQPHQGRLR